jgi:hypothetical protein|nr:MAG TPA: hypothetical protein [Caudoviricetes sp.]
MELNIPLTKEETTTLKARGKNVTFFMQDELDEYPINLTTWNTAGVESKSGIIPQLDIANSIIYSKITEKTIKEALISLERIKKKNGRFQ